MQSQGKISQWMDDQGYGFIETDGQGERVFVHIKAFTDRQRRPVVGDQVAYRLTTDDQGRPRAEEVRFVGTPPPAGKPDSGRVGRFRRRKSRTMSPSALLLVVFFLGLGVVAAAGEASWWVFAYYLAISLVTFGLYAFDKSAAQADRGRIPENILHLMDLLGGWPGGLCARNWLRHKSSKFWFKAIFWVTVTANVGILVGLKISLL